MNNFFRALDDCKLHLKRLPETLTVHLRGGLAPLFETFLRQLSGTLNTLKSTLKAHYKYTKYTKSTLETH